MIGHYTIGNKQSCQLFNIFRSSPSVFLLQSSRRVGLMPQHSCCHSTSTDNLLWKGLFPVEVTPQLLLQVIDIYASISCWEPSTDMKSLLHFPQACRGGRLRDLDVICLWRHTENRGLCACANEFAHARSCPRACAVLSTRINSFNRLERLNHEKRTRITRRFEPSTIEYS